MTGVQTCALPIFGVLAKYVELDEGEVMLSSKGGASIVLKNDGRVLINGKAV